MTSKQGCCRLVSVPPSSFKARFGEASFDPILHDTFFGRAVCRMHKPECAATDPGQVPRDIGTQTLASDDGIRRGLEATRTASALDTRFFFVPWTPSTPTIISTLYQQSVVIALAWALRVRRLEVVDSGRFPNPRK